MTNHPYDDIEAFALGALDQPGAERVLAHADQCPACAVLMAEAMRVAGELEPPDERPLPAPLRLGSLSASSASKRPFRFSELALGYAAAAAVLALMVWTASGIVGVLMFNNRSTSATVPIASLVHSHFEHHALHGPTGSAKVIQSLDGHWLYVLADGLAPRTSYRLWERDGGSEHEIGTFKADAKGQASAYFEQAPAKLSGFVIAPSEDEPTSASALRWP